MRPGQNALEVIDHVKAKTKETEPGLPPGLKIVPIYHRSNLIQEVVQFYWRHFRKRPFSSAPLSAAAQVT